MNGDKKLLGYCGIYCGECAFNKGEIADMSRDLRKKLREYRFDKVAAGLSPFFKDFADYPQCYKVLGAMVKMRCRRACLNGGGDPGCKIRKCCNKKQIQGCWECDDFETCNKLDFLKPVHGDNNFKNMRKIRKSGMEAFLAGPKYW
jgi:hypothetical protein